MAPRCPNNRPHLLCASGPQDASSVRVVALRVPAPVGAIMGEPDTDGLALALGCDSRSAVAAILIRCGLLTVQGGRQ